MAWRFLVIDGADQGRFFPLPEKGTLSIGSRRKDVNLVLHDLYVAPLHCQIDVDGDHVKVTECEKGKLAGTFINGQRITQQELHPGDVLRVGNSHLRLEMAHADAPEPPPDPAPPKELGPAPLLPADRLDELVGHSLGHFQLKALVGKGHSGVVFQAQDLKANHLVTLKVLAPPFPASDQELQHLARVLKPTLSLRHPNLISLYGAGKSGAYCWISREYIEGECLIQVIQRLNEARRIDWRRACRVAVHVARALEYAQEHHVVHGNITPRNLLLQSDDGQTKLGDLLLMKALEGSQLQQETLEKKILAELAYLAPEQVDPDAFVDDLIDLYSLGTIVYALLTGHPAFPGNSPEEVIANIQTGEVARPSTYQRGIPAAFEKVVMRMLAKEQIDRYQRPAELREELEHVAKENEVAV
jgi:serine/threonine protein kinase